MESNSGTIGRNLGRFLWGAALGAVAALLLAPRTGKEAREQLAQTYQEMTGAIAESVADTKEQTGISSANMDQQPDVEKKISAARKRLRKVVPPAEENKGDSIEIA